MDELLFDAYALLLGYAAMLVFLVGVAIYLFGHARGWTAGSRAASLRNTPDKGSLDDWE